VFVNWSWRLAYTCSSIWL